MTIIREQAAKGELGKTAIALTGRKILSLDKLVEDPENERKTFDDMDDLVRLSAGIPNFSCSFQIILSVRGRLRLRIS